MTDRYMEGAVFASREAFESLLQLALSVTPPEGNPEEVSAEVRDATLGLIAGILACSGGVQTSEIEFFQRILASHGSTEPAEPALLEHSNRWASLCNRIPRFLILALEHDRTHQTDVARSMLVPIQVIGNNSCVADRHLAERERRMISRYIRSLEEYLDRERLERSSPIG